MSQWSFSPNTLLSFLSGRGQAAANNSVQDRQPPQRPPSGGRPLTRTIRDGVPRTDDRSQRSHQPEQRRPGNQTSGPLQQRNAEMKMPDILPYMRLTDAIVPQIHLRGSITTTVIDIPAKYRAELQGSTVFDLRVMINLSGRRLQLNDVQMMPGPITVRKKGSAGVYTKTCHPKWTLFKGCIFNQSAMDIRKLLHFDSHLQKDSIRCEVSIEIGFYSGTRGTAVANLFLSRRVNASNLRSSILTSQPLGRDLVEKKRASLAASGIESWTVSLKCPLLVVRVTTPVRFAKCQHLECFDLDAFIAMEMKQPKGRCPKCDRLVDIRTLAVCPFTATILKENPDCDSYRVTQKGIEAVPRHDKTEVIVS